MRSPSRERFVERFGADDAVAIAHAAETHRSGLVEGDKRGSDPFRDCFVVAIGHECMERYREDHGIQASTEDLREWCREQGDWLGEHDGPVDYLALVLGKYEEWMPTNDRELT